MKVKEVEDDSVSEQWSGKNDSGKKKNGEREEWSRKADFVLSCIGYAVGLGNIWRFPYLCYKSGGGAFLIPYFIMLFLCGIPLLLMELAIGQYMRYGPIGSMELVAPIFKGVGVATVVVTFILTTYYNVIIAWSLYYLFNSFRSVLPWTNCQNEWNTNDCYDQSHARNESVDNAVTWFNETINSTMQTFLHQPKTGGNSPSQEFYDHRVLNKTDSIEETGNMRWELFSVLLLSWILVYFCLWKGVKVSGKVVYITVTLPYILLAAFFVNSILLTGAKEGLIFLFSPKWELLLDAKVWVYAAAQNFNSIGIGFGSLIAMSSFNKKKSSLLPESLTIIVVNSATSIFGSIVIFSTLGHIAHVQKRDVSDVLTQGPGLVLVAVPEVIAKMPAPHLWAVLFFLLLLLLGLDSQFAMVEVVITTITDNFPRFKREIIVFIVCLTSLLLGVPHVTQSGIYVFQLVDHYASAISIMFIAFFEVIAITWFYGARRLSANIKEMTGKAPSWYFVICWYVVSPLLILAIAIFSFVDYKPLKYNNVEPYPDWAQAIGWLVAMSSVVCIPLFAILAIYRAAGCNILEKIRNACRCQLDVQLEDKNSIGKQSSSSVSL